MASFVTVTNAQVIKVSDLEQYSKTKYGKNWVEAAKNLKDSITFDKNGGYTTSFIINAEGKTKRTTVCYNELLVH